MRIQRPPPVENPRQCFPRMLAKFVEHGGLMYARNCAQRCTGFWASRFTPDILHGVLIQRNCGPAALLRAVMHQPVLADIKKPAAGAAMPVIRQSSADVLLKMIEMREREQSGFEPPEAFVNTALLRRERRKLAPMIVQNTDRAGEAEFPGALPDHDRVFRIANARAQHGVDGDSRSEEHTS